MAGKEKHVLVNVTRAGKLGGLKRAENLSAAELSEIGKNAIRARWEKYYKDHPEKLWAKLEREREAKKRRNTKRRAVAQK